MAFAKSLPLLSLTLSALYGSVLSGGDGHLGKREVLAGPGADACHTPDWIPACPGVFSCIPRGGICCSDGMTYAMPPQSCPPGTYAVASTGPEADSGAHADGSHSHDSSAPAPTAPPHAPGGGFDFKADGAEFIGGGGNGWFTFAMTVRIFSHYYSLVGGSSVLFSTETTSCTTVSVSATDEAQASKFLSSYTATATFAAPTETTIYPHPYPYPTADVVGSFVPGSSFPTRTATATGGWKYGNGTATKALGPVVTAGASSLGSFGRVAAGMVAFVLGMVALM